MSRQIITKQLYTRIKAQIRWGDTRKEIMESYEISSSTYYRIRQATSYNKYKNMYQTKDASTRKELQAKNNANRKQLKAKRAPATKRTTQTSQQSVPVRRTTPKPAVEDIYNYREFQPKQLTRWERAKKWLGL